jgi:lambda family phage portal protein
MAASAILGPDGRPAQRQQQGRRMAGLNGSGAMPWDAADSTSAEMDGWLPWLGSADADTNFYRDRIVARIRDMVRNDGWTAGGITKITDAVIGADLRLSSIPDYRALSAWAPGFDAAWAKEFSRTAEALWRSWTNDPGLWCEAGRRVTMAGVFRLAFRTLLIEGDALALLLWRPGRMAPGRARYATTVQLIDPDRLSNPQNRMDTIDLRGGVEVDEDGAAVAYHVRKAHLGDWWAAAQAVQWERVPRETDWGRPLVVHTFEADRIGQHRGAGGVLKPVLARAKMLARYEQVELQAAVLNAVFAAYIESPFDRDLVGDSLSPEGGEISAYQQMREGYHSEASIKLNNARIPILAPGEKITSVTAARPASNYPAFQAAALRHMAGALGTSYEQLSTDYSQSTYSSARAALIETWKTLSRRRHEFAGGFCAPIYAAFLEEAMDRGELPLPAGAPDFMEARAEYARSKWIGPGRGWVDPVREPQGALMKVAGALSTLQHEAAESGGLDIEEILDQRALEIQMFADRGLPVPPVLLGQAPLTVTAGGNALDQRPGGAEAEESV